jgi:hypothetical protein
MKTRIEDLTNEQLDEWVARAQGWRWLDLCGWYSIDEAGHKRGKGIPGAYTPTTNPAQWAELMQLFKVDVLHNEYDTQAWACVSLAGEDIDDPIDCFANTGEEGKAICRAVIASVYGDSVEVSDERV